jgi:hypothetical protein
VTAHFIGVCPTCKSWERLNGDGTIASHPARGGGPYEVCPGRRFAPLETIPLQDDDRQEEQK